MFIEFNDHHGYGWLVYGGGGGVVVDEVRPFRRRSDRIQSWDTVGTYTLLTGTSTRARRQEEEVVWKMLMMLMKEDFLVPVDPPTTTDSGRDHPGRDGYKLVDSGLNSEEGDQQGIFALE